MSVIIERETLKEAAFLRSVTSKEHRYIRLSWGSNELHLYSYDGTILTRMALPCETTDRDEALLLSSKWWGIVSNANEGQLALEKLRTNLRITSGDQEVKLRMMPMENFVDVASTFSVSRNTLAAVMGPVLKAGLERVEYAMADSRRPEYMAIRAVFQEEDDFIGLYATDGVKVAGAKIPAKIEKTSAYLIPSKTIKHWGKLLPSEGAVRIFGSPGLVGIEFGEQWSISQTLEDVFPAVEEFLKPPDDVNFLVVKDDLQRAVRQSLVFVDDTQTSIVEMVADGSHLALTTSGVTGEFRELLKANVQKPMEALVNPEMVLDILRKIPGDHVAVAQEKALKPIYMRGVQDFGVSIVMPLVKRGQKTVEEEDGDF